MIHELYEVTGFEIVGAYTLFIEFDDGTSREIDFEPILHGKIYGPLRDRKLFKEVKLDPDARTLVWPNGADFDPETLRNWSQYQDAWLDAAKKLKYEETTSTV